MSHLYKYPRTSHLPYSKGSDDDLQLTDIEHLKNLQDVVVTEKLDGENTTMYRDYIHARSLDSKSHKSRDWIKAFYKNFCYNIPDGYRICGENMYAKHSIYYNKLSSYFYVFAIYDETNICLSWDDTEYISKLLNLEVVPVLYRGMWDETKIKNCYSGVSLYGDEQEGYVIRNAQSFNYSEHEINTAKFVRQNHITTDSHWLSSWNKKKDINKLINHLITKDE